MASNKILVLSLVLYRPLLPVHLVEAIHIELSDEGAEFFMIEVLRQHRHRELDRVFDDKGRSVITPVHDVFVHVILVRSAHVTLDSELTPTMS